ncbi:hypothetical protein [Streptomyces sp. AS02]|uniref:hypothetical protein n=1 Tax=Streptomyces sp. AS02 TaxID=2938946 RepID=UPI00202260D9|nr:hypothetical protein [Streptomyces sp. AS02]MCL8013803.1 hypothetical protein [Streptomyces sp. AS02]
MHEDDLTRGPTLLAGDEGAGRRRAPLAGRNAVTLEDLAGVPLLTIVGDIPEYWLVHELPTRKPSGRPIEQGPSINSLQEALTLVAGGKRQAPAVRIDVAVRRWQPDDRALRVE